MWKNYINIIEKRESYFSHQEYCIWFAGHFSYQLYSLNEFIEFLEKENGDLLPISKNLTDAFYSFNIEFILNLIYHLNDLTNLDFITMKSNDKSNIDCLFNSNDNLYFFNLFSFNNEIILSNDNEQSSLLFLFLFYLPQSKIHDILYHSRKKIPLISCNKITINHFEMLLFLMKTYDENSFASLCQNYNFNLILLEDFCQNNSEIYKYLDFDHDSWYSVLPIEKMKILFNENCSFIHFLTFRNNKVYYTVPTLNEFISYFQKEMEFLKLHEKLTSKNGQLVSKEKVIKI